MKVQEMLWQELERFQMVQEGAASVRLDAEPDILLAIAERRVQAEERYVAASVLMRHIAFMLTGHLTILSRQRLVWTGSLGQVGLIDEAANDRWTPKWMLEGGEWAAVETTEDIEAALRRIVCEHCGHLVQSLSRATHCPSLVLWENVWGYVLWMYVQLFQDELSAEQAQSDLSYLLDCEIWEGVARVSPFQRFLNGQTPEEALKQYVRQTCCLYYKLPGQSKCSYCPNAKEELVCI